MVSWPGLTERRCQLTGQLLLVLLTCTFFASGTEYFITPSLNTSCPQSLTTHCCTLSQLAHDSTRKLEDTNLTLFFLRGNHNLNGNLTLTNLDFLLVSNFNVETVTITCASHLGKFEISQTTTVSMKGLHIIGCRENVVQLVSQFTLENTTFQGMGSSGTMLVIRQTVKASIVSCSFINGRGSLYSLQSPVTVGGAIVASKSSVWVEGTIFKRNSADFGAAIYAQETIISAINSKMMYNTATHEGGALTVVNCSIGIVDSTFIGNRAEENGGVITMNGGSLNITDSSFTNNSADIAGGVISCEGGSFYIADSTISGNKALIGGVIYLIEGSFHIADSTISGNSVDHVRGGGGVIYSEGGSFHIADSTFSGNTARVGGVVSAINGSFHIVGSSFTNGYHGGVIFSNTASFSITNSSFCNNSAGRYGGVITTILGSLRIEDSTFTDNKGDDAGVLNSIGDLIHIVNSSFTNNSAKSAGVIVSVGGSFHIAKCVFSENSANFGGAIHSAVRGSFYIDNSTFRDNVADQGGAIVSTNKSSFHIANCFFTNNTAEVHGVMVALNSLKAVIINSCTFVDNRATHSTLSFVQSLLHVSGNTTFLNNVGSFYAAASNVTFSGITKFENCGDMNFNGGAITSIRSNIYLHGRSDFNSNQGNTGGAIFVRDGVFSISGDMRIANSKANRGGGIYLQQSSFEIIGARVSCLIINNTASLGGGINAFGSTIIVNQPSDLHFIGNNADKGGGIYTEVNTRILMKKYYVEQYDCPELIMNFEDNHATFGGAIFVNDNSNYGACTTFTECFIQVQGLYKITDNIIGVLNPNFRLSTNIYFSDNKASTDIGDNIYGGLLSKCTTDLFSEVYQIKKYVNGIESLTKYNVSNATLDSISSLPVQVCFCNDQGYPDCTYQPPPIHVKKGEAFTVSLTALDQAGHAVETNITSLLSPPDGRFSEGQQTQTVQYCTHLTFNLFSPGESESLIPLAVGSPCRNAVSSIQSVQINFLNCTCPIGFEPSSDPVKCDCLCDSALSPYITRCDSNTSLLLRESTNSWITYVNGTDPYRYVIYPHCPYDYCHPAGDNVSINLTLPDGADSQCAYGHAGVLCGGCQKNLSLSLGSSHCLPCGRFWPAEMFAVLLASIIAGVLLVATLLALNLTVATGLVNGFIFYANIVAASSSAFFSSSKPSYPTVFVAWLNLEVGYDACFIDGLDAYTKTWLQLAFPAYIITLVVLVIVISEHSPRFTRLIGRRDPVATLATLILLSFSKLLSTTIVVLSFAILDYPEGSHVVWLLDGNVKYLQGKHIGLFTAAVVIVLLGVPYTVLLFLWQWCMRTPNWKLFGWIRDTRLSAFITTYHAPYNVKHRYWTGLLLLVRVVLYITAAVTVSSDPEVPLSMTAILIGGLFLLKGIVGSLYKDLLVDVVETLIYFNLLAFAVLSLYHFNSDSTEQTTIAYVSTTITFILLVGVVLIHVIRLVKMKCCKHPAVEELDVAAAVQATGPGTEHAKVTHSYIDFRSLKPQQVNKNDELQLKLISE